VSHCVVRHSVPVRFGLVPPLAPFRLLFFSLLRPPPRSTLFPYTTLFRSRAAPAPPPRPRPRRGRPVGRFRCLSRRLRSFRPSPRDRKSTRLNSSHVSISYAVFCLKKKKNRPTTRSPAERRDTDILCMHTV